MTDAKLPIRSIPPKSISSASVWQSKTFTTSMSMHLDRPVGAMSISPSHRDVALGSRNGLYIIDLDDPYRPPRFLRHTTLWEVADVQWSPHASKFSWLISTSNQKAMVWNLALPSDNAIERVLHAHTRAITDINFHALDPERLATCAVDAFVHCWDMRSPSKPVQSFCDWKASATQVKWNRRNSHVIASSHDRYVHIWDDRMGAIPLRTINAHSTKVYGIDFNRVHETQFISCSLDKTIKYWDYSNDKDEPLRVVHTSFPVWRARHTPFGDGCLVMPQRGGKNGLYLMSNNESSRQGEPETLQPVEEFIGHKEPVKEFLWRSRGGEDGLDNREFQLVTWSKDHDLRLWKLDDRALEAVGRVKNQPLKFRLTRLGTPYETFNRETETEEINQATSAFSALSLRQRSISADTVPRTPTLTESNALRQRHKSRQTQRFMTRGGRKHDRISHLNWLSGVKVGRSAFHQHNVEPTVFTDQEPVPENFGEEVSMVGNKFPKIDFEQIDVANGKLVVGLNGPWAENNEDKSLIFLRLIAKFPASYPHGINADDTQENSPELIIEQSKELTVAKIKEISKNVQDIANQLTKHGRFCLEPCLRYLMGERVNIEDLLSSPVLTTLPGLEVDLESYSSSDDDFAI
ncbi:WD40-repeat-containing domain protein [Lipomyces oligophaga]|uniref:WD40-repeat-containing domain protein n=1 Tax=Lipomyces oligophaga TaxID=45792 RepID=UPI0034CDA8E3